jgi:hypothetical protein
MRRPLLVIPAVLWMLSTVPLGAGSIAPNVFDSASTPFQAIALSGLAIPGYANNVAVSSGYAYVAAGSLGLQVVNVFNPNSPVIVASRDTAGNANDVRLAGGLAVYC